MKKLFLGILFSSGIVFAKDIKPTSIGSIAIRGNGDFKITRSDGHEDRGETIKDIYEGDIITTNTAKVKVVMVENRAIINVMPNSELKFSSVKIKSKTGMDVHLNLNKGKIRSDVKNEKHEKDVHYEVHTSNGVLGVRGTEFIVSYTPAVNVEAPSEKDPPGTTEEITLRGIVEATLTNAHTGSSASKLGFQKFVTVSAKQLTRIVELNQPTTPVDMVEKDFAAADAETFIPDPPAPPPPKPKLDNKKKSK